MRKLAGTMPIKLLAKAVGSSDSTLDRWAKHSGVNINWLKYSEDTVKAVCEYYSEHGREATAKAFPDVRVRSIVEKYPFFKPRQIRWSDSEIIEAARMAGLVSTPAQARFFNRPNAHEGSINSLWHKKFGLAQGSINGLVRWYAKPLVTGRARYIRPKGLSRNGEITEFRNLILWVDLEKSLKPDAPAFIREAVETMAKFQRWLHGEANTRKRILKMISDRENAA